MNCDVCGQVISGKPLKVAIEGARVMACPDCAELGEPIAEVETRLLAKRPPMGPAKHVIGQRQQPPVAPSRAPGAIVGDAMRTEIVEDYPILVRRAREKIGLTQEDLAKKMNEKVTVIQRVEAGRMVPDLRLARMFEHYLRIRLLTPVDSSPATAIAGAKPTASVTLGDIVQIRRRSTAK